MAAHAAGKRSWRVRYVGRDAAEPAGSVRGREGGHGGARAKWHFSKVPGTFEKVPFVVTCLSLLQKQNKFSYDIVASCGESFESSYEAGQPDRQEAEKRIACAREPAS